MEIKFRTKLKYVCFMLFKIGLVYHTSGQSISYTYDNLNRLTQIQYSNGSKISYIYDASGNRLQQKTSFTSVMLPYTVKCQIQGYYSGGANMSPVLLNQGVSGASSNITDSIRVELRRTTTPYAVYATYKGVIQTNGIIQCSFPTALGDNMYYIVLKHRNGIETWSSQPQLLQENSFYDFTTSASQAYGSNQVEVEPGVFAIYSGDINQDENIDLLDQSILDFDIETFQFGYQNSDLNGDGNVDLLDQPTLEVNSSNFIFSQHP